MRDVVVSEPGAAAEEAGTMFRLEESELVFVPLTGSPVILSRDAGAIGQQADRERLAELSQRRRAELRTLLRLALEALEATEPTKAYDARAHANSVP